MNRPRALVIILRILLFLALLVSCVTQDPLSGETTSSSGKLLAAAIKAGDVDQALKILTYRPELFTILPRESGCSHIADMAAENDDTAMIGMLLVFQQSSPALYPYGLTAKDAPYIKKIRSACGLAAILLEGNTKSSRLVMNKYKDAALTDDEGSTVLHTLAKLDPRFNSSFWIFNNLLDGGADVQARDARSKTALHYAIENDGVQLAERLIGVMIDLDPPGSSVTSYEELARANGLSSLVPLIEKRRRALKEHPESAFELAIANGTLEAFIELMGKNPEAAKRAVREGTYTESIIKNNRIDILEYMLKNGADPNEASGYFSDTPLHFAAKSNNPEMTGYLLAAGADPRVFNENGNLPFHEAVDYESLDVVRLYLKKGMDVDQKDKAGFTPVFGALVRKKMKSVALLLDQGAEFTNGRYNGTDLLTGPIGDNDFPMVRLLLEKAKQRGVAPEAIGASVEYAVYTFAEEEAYSLDMVRLMFDTVGNPEWDRCYEAAMRPKVTERIRALLDLLVGKGMSFSRYSLADLLPHDFFDSDYTDEARRFYVERYLSHGGDINRTDEHGRNALHKVFAYSPGEFFTTGDWSHTQVDGFVEDASAFFLPHIRFLESFGIDLFITDTMDNSLLMYAAMHHARELAGYLIDRGLDVNRMNVKKHTPLLVALKKGNETMMRYLMQKGADHNLLPDPSGFLSLLEWSSPGGYAMYHGYASQVDSYEFFDNGRVTGPLSEGTWRMEGHWVKIAWTQTYTKDKGLEFDWFLMKYAGNYTFQPLKKGR